MAQKGNKKTKKMNKWFKNFLVKNNIIKGVFFINAFVYVDETTGLVTLSSNKIKNLQPFSLKCRQKDVDYRAFDMLTYKYPEYAGYIRIYKSQFRG